jgi:hypothetical protein
VMCDASLAKPFASRSFSAAIKILYTTRLVPHLHLESRIRMNTATPPLPYMPSWLHWDKHTFYLPNRRQTYISICEVLKNTHYSLKCLLYFQNSLEPIFDFLRSHVFPH